VWIAGGTFLMGSDRHYPEEKPEHKVSVELKDPKPGFYHVFVRCENEDESRYAWAEVRNPGAHSAATGDALPKIATRRPRTMGTAMARIEAPGPGYLLAASSSVIFEKNWSSIIFETPPSIRWPTLAMRPPTWTSAL